MTYRIGFDKMVDLGDYRTILHDNETRMELTIDAISFQQYLTVLLKEVPEDFMDLIRIVMIDCAERYFEENRVPQEDCDKFFEMLDAMTEDTSGEE